MIDWDTIRHKIAHERGWACEICHGASWTELHHCIEHDTKEHHEVLSVPINLQAVCKSCHDKRAKSKNNRAAVRAAQEARGYDVAGWLAGLPFKVKRL